MTEKNQIENQIDFNFEKSLISENEENMVCNIYKEQFDLINELPIEDRCKVLYIAISKAFYDCEKKSKRNQFENQIENTYIYNSISISNSISIYSKKLLSLLFKTILCKNYSKNRGGKREGAGRKKTTPLNAPTKEEILNYVNQQLGKPIDADSFIAYYNAAQWKDNNGLPINWKQKAVSWVNRQKVINLTDKNEVKSHYRNAREITDELQH